jgi:hypothetical protein
MKKIAIVTGASRGLGRGTALIFATEGNYSVYATARNADALLYQSQALFRYNTLFTQQVTATLPCNTNLEAGDVIECLFPETTTKKKKEYDQMQSGLYMIKELRHHFDPNGSYTAVKLVRDTYGQSNPNNEEK